MNELKQLPGLGRAQLPVMLAQKFPAAIGAEVGVQRGEYSEQLLKAGVRFLHLVDLWAQQPDYFDIANVADAEHQKNFKETCERMVMFRERHYIHRGPSVRMSHSVKDDSLDFVYLDADHKYKAIKADLAAWYPKVRAGGVISGHDFMDSPNCCGSEFGVASAVQEFCREIGVTELFVCTDECFPNWHFIKPKLNP